MKFCSKKYSRKKILENIFTWKKYLKNTWKKILETLCCNSFCFLNAHFSIAYVVIMELRDRHPMWKTFSQKQPSRRVLRERRSEDMQQIYRRTPMSKCNFNKVARQLYWNHTFAWVFSCKFAAYFKNISS